MLEQVVDPSGSPATLFTSNPRNLPFYDRVGFRTVHERQLEGEHSFTYWFTVRPVGGG